MHLEELEIGMDVHRIVSELDTEIARLQQIRAALTGLDAANVSTSKGRRGRPKGSKNLPKGSAAAAAKPFAAKTVAPKAVAAPVVKKAARKGNLSAEGRKRIADAMKKRWAERRKAAAK
jgi:hypothetical protein